MPARRYSGERRHRHHHHHHLGGYGMRRVHHHHHHGTGHRRLNTWQVFVKTHMRPGQTLRHLAQMYMDIMDMLGCIENIVFITEKR